LDFGGNHRGMAFAPSPSGSRYLMVEMRKLLPPNKGSAPQGYKSHPQPLEPPPSPPLPPPQLQEKPPSSSFLSSKCCVVC